MENIENENLQKEDFQIDEKTNVLVKYLGNEQHVLIPEGVVTIGDGAFKNKKFTSISIPGTVQSIGHYAFSGCRNLTSISIPRSVQNIGHYAFSGCKNLTSIDIPDSILLIGDYAFKTCKQLTAVEIPQSVRRIGKGAFDCTAICRK